MALVELRGIGKVYDAGEMKVPVLRDVTLSIESGEYVALVGASGSGKTTLMNILGCLDKATSGSYRLDGREVTTLGSDDLAEIRSSAIGFVFQSFNLLRRTTALENVMMPLSYGKAGVSDAEAMERARELLAQVGLAERLGHEPSQLSGGQQQRVAIARALVNRPSILLADEPTGNLDSRTTEEILAMFRDLNERSGLTLIVVTHESDVAQHAKRIVRLHDGEIREDHLTAHGLSSEVRA